MGILRIYNHIARQRVYADRGCRIPLELPTSWESYDQISIEYTALANPVAPYEAITDGAPEIGIFKTSDGTQLAYQNAFTLDAERQLFTGTLSLADAAFAAAVNALTPEQTLDGLLSIKWVDNTGKPHTALERAEILLRKRLITVGSATAPVEDTAATQSWVNGNYAALDMDDSIIGIRTAPGGSRWLITIDDNGDLAKQRLS